MVAMDTLILKEVAHKSVSDKMWGEMFPTVIPRRTTELLELNVNKDMYGYLCLEYGDGDCILHVHMFEQHKTREKISHLVKGFADVIRPHVKKNGVNQILAHCDYEDIKTMELSKTFGFTPIPIWVASMEV